jgi:hypothetical protein
MTFLSRDGSLRMTFFSHRWSFSVRGGFFQPKMAFLQPKDGFFTAKRWLFKAKDYFFLAKDGLFHPGWLLKMVLSSQKWPFSSTDGFFSQNFFFSQECFFFIQRWPFSASAVYQGIRVPLFLLPLSSSSLPRRVPLVVQMPLIVSFLFHPTLIYQRR